MVIIVSYLNSECETEEVVLAGYKELGEWVVKNASRIIIRDAEVIKG